jgi:hypothetical protein
MELCLVHAAKQETVITNTYNVSANVTYGTKRVNAYDIIEDSGISSTTV